MGQDQTEAFVGDYCFGGHKGKQLLTHSRLTAWLIIECISVRTMATVNQCGSFTNRK